MKLGKIANKLLKRGAAKESFSLQSDISKLEIRIARKLAHLGLLRLRSSRQSFSMIDSVYNFGKTVISKGHHCCIEHYEITDAGRRYLEMEKGE
jgi:hypothetical protein